MTEFTETLDGVAEDLEALRAALNGVIVGQEALIDNILIALFAGGHVLLEGLPGLGKTHIAKATSAVLDLQLGRVQCTPDLLPADITGSEVLAGEKHDIEFRPGPVFANLLLVDEINRATPRTQSALLEAMQEQQVTYAGVCHPLPQPFCVIATQNPIELEGTFPLPEAQLDRFLFKITVDYPSAESLARMLETSLDSEPADAMTPLITRTRTMAIRDAARQILVATPVKASAIAMVLATQPASVSAAMVAKEHLHYGASPRALQALIRAARVKAMFAGRAHADFADIAAVARPVLAHRILLSTRSELEGQTPSSILDELLGEWQNTYLK